VPVRRRSPRPTARIARRPRIAVSARRARSAVGDASRSGPASLLPPDRSSSHRLPDFRQFRAIPGARGAAGRRSPAGFDRATASSAWLVPPLLFLAQPAATRQAESNNVAKRPVRRDSLNALITPCLFRPKPSIKSVPAPLERGHHGMGKTLPQSGRLTSSPASQSCLSCRPSPMAMDQGLLPALSLVIPILECGDLVATDEAKQSVVVHCGFAPTQSMSAVYWRLPCRLLGRRRRQCRSGRYISGQIWTRCSSEKIGLVFPMVTLSLLLVRGRFVLGFHGFHCRA